MALELSTAGIQVLYAPEATAGTRPTSGYTVIPNVKSIPEFNPEPSNIQVTDLSDEEWHRYIPGLKDPGGAIGLTVNLNTAFKTAWTALMTSYNALTGGKQMWFEFQIPGMDSFYFPGMPSELGFGGAEVDSVLEATAYVSPNGAPVWATAST